MTFHFHTAAYQKFMTSLLLFPISFAISCTLIFGTLPPDLSAFPMHLAAAQWPAPDSHPELLTMPETPFRSLFQVLSSLKEITGHFIIQTHILKFFFVFADASSATITSLAFPVLTAFSVENSPLATFPAFIERPISDTVLFLFNRIQLLFKRFVDLFRNGRLKRTFQSLIILCLFKALL